MRDVLGSEEELKLRDGCPAVSFMEPRIMQSDVRWRNEQTELSRRGVVHRHKLEETLAVTSDGLAGVP